MEVDAGGAAPSASSPPHASASASSSSAGRVVRIHLACRAPLPIGSELRVTGSHLWDPTDALAADPHGARRVVAIAGRDAYSAGASGFAGGSLGMGAGNVVNEDEAAVTGDGTVTPLGRDLVADRVMMGIGDDAAGGEHSWYASSVEMVTCPDTYPVWRTRKPVVVVLTDPPEKDGGKGGGEGGDPIDVVMGLADDEDSLAGDGSNGAGGRIYRHHYRYLVVTPGAENDGAHGLPTFDNEEEDISNLLSRTKISHGSLGHLHDWNETASGTGGGGGMDAATSSGGRGSGSFPVTLWENPFLIAPEEVDDDGGNRGLPSREFSVSSSAGALSMYSEAATSVRWGGRDGGGHAMQRDYVLANLPYRTLDIDVDTASVVHRKPADERMATEDAAADSSSQHTSNSASMPKYTDDGVLIDNWNGCDDLTYRPYVIREGMRAAARDRRRRKEELGSDADMISSASEGDAMVAMVADEGGAPPAADADGKAAPAPRRRIYIVCYHLPVIVSKNPHTGEWQACWAESLLARTANSSFVSSCDPHWVGTVTTVSPIEGDDDRRALQAVLAKMDCTALFFDEGVRDAHYRGFCKQVLWLAFHHVDLLDMSDPAFSMDLDAAESVRRRAPDGSLHDLRSSWDQAQVGRWWEAFNVVNATFAREVARMVTPDDVVWVHDYHLSLLPRMLEDEEKRVQAMANAQTPPRLTKKIFFLHIPFPVSMIFKEMECGPSILEGILHADVVGFHGFTDARHFLSCAKRILGVSHESLEGGLIGVKYEERLIVVTMSSVSIEPHLVNAVMQLPSTVDGEKELRARHAGKIIIAGLDVAQYLSGVGLKLAAYERLLEDAPAWRNRLVLVQHCLIPGARRLDEATTVRQIRIMVQRIKKKYGDGVIHYEETFGSTLPLDQRLALWKASDCLLSTEVRAGMNLLPLEYVYAQKGLEVPGIVIASEFSAVFGILNGALRISPFDRKLILATLDKALTMSKEEREGRYLRDEEFVSSSSSDQWIQNVLRDLRDQSLDDDVNNETEKKSFVDVPTTAEFLGTVRDEQFTRLDPKSILSAYKSSSRRVIILDFNGTIVMKQAVDSFLKRDAVGSTGNAPPHAVCESLERLCADPQNTVFVVSGDNNENVQRAIGHLPGLGLAASNGSSFSPPVRPGGSRMWLALDLGVNWDSVKRVALPIMSKFTARTNGSFIKLAHSSLGWSYYDCDPEFGSLMAKYLVIELEKELSNFDVRFVNLKGIVEVIPGKLNKGIIVKKILRDVAARDGNAGVDFVLCMGDDISDEKMFTSVFSFVSEMNEDYVNVIPSPPVIQLTPGTLPASQSFLVEAPCLRCRESNAPMFAFTVAVGKKPSHASQFVDGAEDVADLLVKMAAGSADAYYQREGEGERHLMQFS